MSSWNRKTKPHRVSIGIIASNAALNALAGTYGRKAARPLPRRQHRSQPDEPRLRWRPRRKPNRRARPKMPVPKSRQLTPAAGRSIREALSQSCRTIPPPKPCSRRLPRAGPSQRACCSSATERPISPSLVVTSAAPDTKLYASADAYLAREIPPVAPVKVEPFAMEAPVSLQTLLLGTFGVIALLSFTENAVYLNRLGRDTATVSTAYQFVPNPPKRPTGGSTNRTGIPRWLEPMAVNSTRRLDLGRAAAAHHWNARGVARATMRVRLSSCWRGSPMRHGPSRESRGLPFRANSVHPAALSRPRPLFPRSGRPGHLAGLPLRAKSGHRCTHSITPSASCWRPKGTSRPSAFAVFRLRINSNLVGCSIGMSAGFVPRNILSTISAARRYMSGTFGP